MEFPANEIGARPAIICAGRRSRAEPNPAGFFPGFDPAVLIALGNEGQPIFGTAADAAPHRAICGALAISDESDAITGNAQAVAAFARVKRALRRLVRRFGRAGDEQ